MKTFKEILELNGIEDAIWALRTVEGFDKEKRLFACDCAESVLHIFEKEYPNNKQPRKAIETARLFAEGKATNREMVAAASAASSAASAAAVDTYATTYATFVAAYAAKAAANAAADVANADANAAVYAAYAAVDAASYAAVDAAERKKQEQFLLKYL